MSAHSRRAKRKRAHARKIAEEGRRFHEARVKWLTKSGRLDKLLNSGYMRRHG